jgi:multiple sugar transport system substrate-binding protein
MKRRQAILVALTVGSALALSAGCSSSSGNGPAKGAQNFSAKPTGTLNAWAFDNADDVGKARIAYAKQQLAGVNVKYDQTGFNAQKFTTRLASGNVPDVVQMDRQFVASYAAQGLIMPLDKCYSDNKVDPQKLFYKSVIDDVTYKNQVWGVPQFFQPPAIMLDKNVMAAAGVSDSDIDTSNPTALLAAIGKMYKSSGGKPTTVGFDPQGSQNPYLWVLGLGGKISDSSGAPTLDDPANAYPLETLKQIYDAQGGYAKFKSFTDSFDFFGGKNQYVKNQVGAEVNFQWYPNVLAAYKDKISLETVPLKNKSGQPIAVTSGQAFVIPTRAKNPTAACKWALDITSQGSWMAAAAARADTLSKSGGVNTGLFTGQPAADKAIKAQYVKPSGNAGFDQTINAFYGVVSSGVSYGASPAGQEIQTALTNAIVSVCLGQKSAKSALSDAQSDAMRAYKAIVH